MEAEADQTPIEDLLAESQWIQHLARGLEADPAGGEDLVQETWLAALRRPPRRSGTPRGWLARVLRNFAWQRAREERPRIDADALKDAHAEGITPAGEEAEKRELQRLLVARVLALPEPYRRTVLMRYYGGHSAAEIGRRRNLSAATVRSHLKRGLDKLREDLDRRFGRDRAGWTLACLGFPGRRSAADTSTGGISTASGASVRAETKVLFAAVFTCALIGPVWWGITRLERRTSKPLVMARIDEEVSEKLALATLGSVEQPGRVRTTTSADRTGASPPSVVPTGTRVLVKVVVPDGSPVAGAVVEVVDRSAPRTGRLPARRALGTTGPDGRVDVVIGAQEIGTPEDYPSMEGRATFLATSEGLAGSRLYHVICPTDDPKKLIIEVGGPDLVFRGRVLDAQGLPVPGALIEIGNDVSDPRLLDNGEFLTSRGFEAISARDGTYAISNLALGRHRVHVTAAGYVPAWRYENVLEGAIHECTLVLERGGTLLGIVQASDGAPQPGARVWYDRLEGGTTEVIAGADGSYRLEGLAEGDYTFWARAPDRRAMLARLSRRVSVGEDVLWHPTLRPMDGIRLRLVDEHKNPLPGWIVTFGIEGHMLADWRRELSTDAEGRVALYDCPEKPVRVLVFSPAKDAFPVMSVGGVRPGPEERVLSVPARKPEPGTVRGYALDDEARSFEEIALTLMNLDLEVSVGLVPDPGTGEFRCNVAPGRYQIEARCGGMGTFPLGLHDVAAGELLDLGTVLAPQPGILRIDGYWPDAGSGESYEFLLANAFQLGGEWIFEHIDQGAKRPRSVYRVLPGYYSIVIGRNGQTIQKHHVHVEAGREARLQTGPGALPQVPFRFLEPAARQPSTSLRFRILSLGSGDAEDGETVLEEELRRSAHGVFDRFVGLPDGRYLVEAETDSGLRGRKSFDLVSTAVVMAVSIRLE